MEKNKIKKIVLILTLVLLIVIALLLSNVFKKDEPPQIYDGWDGALYTEDTELGEGDKTVFVEVRIKERAITFKIHTDENMLGDALIAHGLVEGEESEYGLYIKKVNGILADYNVDGSYWGFYQNGEYMMSGVDTTEINGGEHFELVYEK